MDRERKAAPIRMAGPRVRLYGNPVNLRHVEIARLATRNRRHENRQETIGANALAGRRIVRNGL